LRCGDGIDVNSALFSGYVYHKRLRPAVHVLRYRVFTMLLALDEIDALEERLWLFSRNRWNLFSFYDKDFGQFPTESLQHYVLRQLNDAGIEQKPHRILLTCYPRICGYTFNPLSLFYCLDERDQPIAILHEVHNTFGERHVYVLPVEPELDSQDRNSSSESIQWINQSIKKALFVSPFAHMNMRYDFRLNVPDKRQILVIHAHDEDGHLLTASYTAERQTLSVSGLLRYFFTVPFLTFKVVAGIHWEAFRLWLKKVPVFSHQPKQSFSSNNLNNP